MWSFFIKLSVKFRFILRLTKSTHQDELAEEAE